VATSDICALDDSACRLHIHQGAALAIHVDNPKSARRLIFLAHVTVRQPIYYNPSRPRSVSSVKGWIVLAKPMLTCKSKSIDDQLFGLFLDYNGTIHVYQSLLNAVLHDKPEIRGEEGDPA
jgi:hypothetical protein